MRYFIYHSRAAADGVVAKPEVRPAPGRWLVPRLGFFLHFLSVSLSLSLSRVFFCCLLLWRNGPEMQRIGYGDRDRGWDCDWGFTWLQNKLIQNQQETRNEADDKMGHATTETVTETVMETETGAAGGRWPDIVVVRCEARPGADEAQVWGRMTTLEFRYRYRATPNNNGDDKHTHTHTHVNLYVYRCIQCWITQLISVTWFITFCVCFRCMSQTTFNFNFIYLHFCAFHTREEERGNEEWGWPTSRWPPANAAMQLQLRHCRRTRNEERGASWAAVAGQTRLHLKIKMFYLWDRLGNVLLARPRVICIKRRTQRALRCQLLKHSA